MLTKRDYPPNKIDELSSLLIELVHQFFFFFKIKRWKAKCYPPKNLLKWKNEVQMEGTRPKLHLRRT
jgi:hypothetical protein